MPTAREAILADSRGDLTGKTGPVYLDTLFNNLCRYAQSNYSYNATRVLGLTADMLLASPTGQRKTVDCGCLAAAFALMARENLGVADAGTECVGAGSWATKEHSKCFDNRIVGNVRTATAHFVTVSRCVFSTHAFARAAGRFFDPCLLTTYQTREQVITWKFEPAKPATDYYPILYRIAGDPSKLMIRIPDGAPQPFGFMSSFLQVETKDLDKAAYREAFGVDKPGWQMATKSVGGLLKAAGITAQWPNLR